MEKIHVHVSTHERDCDGPLYRDWVVVPDPKPTPEYVRPQADYDDDATWEAYLLGRINVFAEEIHIRTEVRKVEDDEGNERYLRSAEWGGPTEEGHYHEQHEACINPTCNLQGYRQRDVYAEQMGY